MVINYIIQTQQGSRFTHFNQANQTTTVTRQPLIGENNISWTLFCFQ